MISVSCLELGKLGRHVLCERDRDGTLASCDEYLSISGVAIDPTEVAVACVRYVEDALRVQTRVKECTIHGFLTVRKKDGATAGTSPITYGYLYIPLYNMRFFFAVCW